MKINQAFRYELKPNFTQRILLAKHAGTARFAYNWGLAERIRLFEAKEGKERFTTAAAQHKTINALKSAETGINNETFVYKLRNGEGKF